MTLLGLLIICGENNVSLRFKSLNASNLVSNKLVNMNSNELKGKIVAILFLLFVSNVICSQDLKYPKTKKVVKKNNYHGTTINDNYSWLDDVKNEEVVAWTKVQDDFMRSYVRSIPQYDKLKKKVTGLMNFSGSTVLPAQNSEYSFFAQVNEEGKGILYKRKTGTGNQEALELPFDARAAMFILPSPDSKYLALAMARPGGYYDWKVYDVSDQKLMEETLVGAQMADTRLSWTTDSQGFYYVAMDAGTNQQSPRSNRRVSYHRVGTAADTDKEVYALETQGSKMHLDVSDDGQYLVIAERGGASTAAKIKYMATKGPDQSLKSLVDEAEASYIFLGNDGAIFYFQTDLGAPNGKIVSVNINQATRVWKDLIPELDVPMSGFQSAGGTMLPMMAGNKFVIPVQQDLKIDLKIYGLTGKFERQVTMPSGGLFFRTNGLNALSGSRESDEIMAQFMGITEPNTIFSVNVKNGKVSSFSRAKVQFDASGYTSEIIFAKSKDGSRVPISLTYKKGLKRNGKNFLMMQVYGALAFTNYPYFQGDYITWLEMGGIHAVAHIRGGGAYGSKWHQDGIARKKQNGTDDYIAALEKVIKEKYTTGKRIALNGVSAGTIPVGAVMTQRPDLSGAILSHYGMLDMIGYGEKLGDKAAFAYMMPEIGNAANPEDFKVLNTYSPYQKIEKGIEYPAVLALTSDADGPLNADSYKFIAKLQEINTEAPAFIQMAWGSGHTQYGSQQHSPVDTFTDEIAFLIKALKMDVGDWLNK